MLASPQTRFGSKWTERTNRTVRYVEARVWR